MSQRTFCRICQAYCGLEVDVADGRVERVGADRSHPVSRGYTCSKGRALAELHTDPRRLLHHRLHGQPVPATTLLDDLAARLDRIRTEHGPDAIAVYRGTAAYFDSAALVALGALVSGLGTRSLFTTSTIDQVARYWVSEQMCGMFNALPLIDQERARCTILVGTNPPVSHGHVGSWPDPVVRLRRLAGLGTLWCLDVRATETTAQGRHLAPRPGRDWAVLGHLVREMLHEGADHEFLARHAHQVDELRAAVTPLDRARASALAGVAAGDLDDLVADVRAAGQVAVNTGTGTTMGPFGDVTEWMAWALMGVTGSLDRPGGVWFNPGVLRPRRQPGSPSAEDGPASRPGLLGRFGERPTAALVDEIEAGNVRALLVAGGNPLRAVPGTQRLTAACRNLEVLAVADVVEGATVAAATHVLACAAQFERPDVALVESMYPVQGTQYTPALIEPPGEATALFDLWSGLADRLGIRRVAPDPESVFDQLAGPQAEPLRTERLLARPAEFGWFSEHVLPEGRWALAPRPLVDRLAAALADSAAPAHDGLDLVPRRQIGQMNTLFAGRRDRPDLLVSPADAKRLGLADGARARVSTAGGEVDAVVRLDTSMRVGVVSLPHGFDEPNISDLTVDTDNVHPEYGMPRLSAVPVSVHPRSPA